MLYRLIMWIVRICLLLALAYAVVEAIGLNFVTAFFIAVFGPWVELFASHNISLTDILTHPITLIIAAIAIFGKIQEMRR